jgi:fused signal recognition particle receptor
MAFFGLFSKEKKEALDKGLEKTKTSFFSKLTKAVAGKSKVDDEILDELENILISSDVGVETTLKIIRRIEERVKRDKYLNTAELDKILREEIIALLAENKSEDLADFEIPSLSTPYVIMVVGVNGVGKTTTIGKIAAQYHQKGKKSSAGGG